MHPITIFFDIGDTLAVAKVSANGVVERLKPFPFVLEILDRLRGLRNGSDLERIRLGVISNTEAESRDSMLSLLGGAGLLDYFDEDLLLFSSVENMNKTQKEFFELAAMRAAMSPARCIFVGESEAERKVAATAGLRVSFHPLHVFHIIDEMP